MRRIWLAAPALFLLTGCAQFNPALMYQEAARQLRFSLDRVEPSIQLAFPLEDSRVGIRLRIAVDNPSQVHFRARGLSGQLKLEEGTAVHSIGQVAFSQGIDLPPGARSQMPVDLSFSYRDLKQAWGPLGSVIRGHQGTWNLEGQLQLEAFGIPFTLPLRASKSTGS
jgi:LEA14-like dessication related protein